MATRRVNNKFKLKQVEVSANPLDQMGAMNELVFVFGTGSSLALTAGKQAQLSWKGLLSNGLSEAYELGRISEVQAKTYLGLLESSDIDDLLSVAEYVGRKMEAPTGDLYSRWLRKSFERVLPVNEKFAEAVRAIAGSGALIATLNYDRLLESVTDLPSVLMSDVRGATEWMRGAPGVLHLHGVWTDPNSVVLGIRDYEKTTDDETRSLFQRTFTAFKKCVFIGCGDTFSDPNFRSLITWLRSNLKGTMPQHFALVTESEQVARRADPTWQGFVDPLCYGASVIELPGYLLRMCSSRQIDKDQPLIEMNPAAEDSKSLLEEYLLFLINECGKMTIEGLRADMDTAQRKFDLELLFVPLHVHPVPPSYQPNDPDREAKLDRWREKNREPIDFGTVFKRNKKIALLALPGGGKTLLLKRIAVAYADSQRLADAADNLPQLDLYPILIKCREWRDDIKRPISRLLDIMADFTGRPNLRGFGSALKPLLDAGKVLLMIDGLDEIHDDADRATFVDNLEKFHDEFPKIRLLITSREAGFELVAPSLSRFCKQFRIAPLSNDSIALLCDHWRALMGGDTPDAYEESATLVDYLLKNDSIRRLAENPLLLTMLLVVKNGAGRLPPDRVSLYERAVEVLLDTWNIKGHEPLNLKEAVPQLACVAFELLKQGKQTATKEELLRILEQARESLPQIARYAKDSPDEFLRRVELRSSLLVEAGRQIEGARLVSFYQFRHLTFQEYLAAFAAVEGNYIDYKRGDTVLTPLSPHLLSDEWKEVVPMAAVLAKKQADVLISELLSASDVKDIELAGGLNSSESSGVISWSIPNAVARLIQCLVEEVEIPSEYLESVLRLAARFAFRVDDRVPFAVLAQGPYGAELYRQAWNQYVDQAIAEGFFMRNTCAMLAFGEKSISHWNSDVGRDEIYAMLKSSDFEVSAKGVLTVCGLYWGRVHSDYLIDMPSKGFIVSVERLAARDEPYYWEPAIWAWALRMFCRPKTENSIEPSLWLLERVKNLFLTESRQMRKNLLGFALYSTSGMKRDYWKPGLDDLQRAEIRENIANRTKKTSTLPRIHDENFLGTLVLAFHDRTVTDTQLAKAFAKVHSLGRDLDLVVRQLNVPGSKGNRPISEE